MKKKILALFTAAGMILSTLPTYAFSTESGTCGKNLTWTLADGTLTISGTGDMEDYEHPEADRPPEKWTSKISWKWYISNYLYSCKKVGKADLSDRRQIGQTTHNDVY